MNQILKKKIFNVMKIYGITNNNRINVKIKIYAKIMMIIKINAKKIIKNYQQKK